MKLGISDGYLERLLEQHYRREVYGIHAAPDLWQRPELRLGAQQKPSATERIVGTLAGRPAAAPRFRTLGYVLAAGCLLAAAVLPIRLAASQPRGTSTGDLAAGSAKTAPSGRRIDKTPAGTYGLSAGTATPGGPTGNPQATEPSPPGRARGSPSEPTRAPTSAAQAVRALSVGTLEEAGEAIGVSIILPSYLPAGAEREEDQVRYQAQDGHGYASIGYRVRARPSCFLLYGPGTRGAAAGRGTGHSRPLRGGRNHPTEGAVGPLAARQCGRVARRGHARVGQRRSASGRIAQGRGLALPIDAPLHL